MRALSHSFGRFPGAIEIAKQNPEFEYVPSASIEVRPIKTKETETRFVYPITVEEK